MRMKLASLTALAAFALPAAALDVTITTSEDFQEKLEKDYGERELGFLSDRIEDRMTDAFEDFANPPAAISVEIIDAKPNRPTFKQLSDNPSLDFGGSLSIGGADLIATAYDQSGAELVTVEYDWYETDLSHVRGFSTWSDANRAVRRLASKMSEAVTQEAGS